MHGFNGMGWGMGFGWIFGLFALVAVVWFLIRMTRTSPDLPEYSRKSALDFLNERYARGEIDKKEYEDKKESIL